MRTWASYTEHAGTGSRDEDTCVMLLVEPRQYITFYVWRPGLISFYINRRYTQVPIHTRPCSVAFCPRLPLPMSSPPHPPNNLDLLHALRPEEVILDGGTTGTV